MRYWMLRLCQDGSSRSDHNVVFIDWGKVTTLPWGMTWEGSQYAYHPVHLYRAGLMWIAGGWWWLRRSRYPTGHTFSLVDGDGRGCSLGGFLG
ncbi:hypothetical protein [Marinithermofilum abyssi]|uniref:hypothetical protein n=1 Tax=Marinithermofilum abyssi TaxID=1571185 RepID=UPI00166C9A58|nr:hypothetical protein [Marinithermofilum abyssi]